MSAEQDRYEGTDTPEWNRVRELTRTTFGIPACCDLHSRNCEPPSELCCDACSEQYHGIRAHACIAPDLSGNGSSATLIEKRYVACPFCLELVGVCIAFESSPVDSVWHEECYDLDPATGPTRGVAPTQGSDAK